MTPLKSNPTARNACPDGRLCQFARTRSELYPEARQFSVGGFTSGDESLPANPKFAPGIRSRGPGSLGYLPNTTPRL